MHNYTIQGASTLYGPRTLSARAYIQEFNKLAISMAKGDKTIKKDPSPPHLSSVQLKLVQDPFGDSLPPGANFGDIKQDIALPESGSFTKVDTPSATFWSPTPRHDLMIEGTFGVVETLQGERWVPTYDNNNFSVFFKCSG